MILICGSLILVFIWRRKHNLLKETDYKTEKHEPDEFSCFEKNGFIRMKGYRLNQAHDLAREPNDELYSVKQFKTTYPEAKGFFYLQDKIQHVSICDPMVIHEFLVDQEKYYERDVTVSYIARILGDSLLFSL